MRPPDNDRQPHTLLGEIPVWILVAMVILFAAIVVFLYNPHWAISGR